VAEGKTGRCRWPWSHNWTKWTTTERGTGYRSESSFSIGRYEMQRRECIVCGKSQLRETMS